ncbi:centrosomal protein cep290 [Anopheles arabiensis]|uniref:centrosomal protein cep290 n=1 Tax=Anopheles arabiensis TaxID=7173 RepID=UPI001AAD3C3E|nr:centrosomal protein cep290 [Anopheles arabiensis]
MDWKHLLSLSPHNLDDVRKDGAALEIANLSTDVKLDSKSSKKLFRLAQVALRFRNEQVRQLKQTLVEGKDDFGSQERMKEWKRTIEKLELERHTLRTKLKDVTEENAKLQAKLAEGLHGGSEGEDSPDALSEIERQQELYNNISMKNKHIKRLLRDIDDLEKRNSFQVDTINGLQVSLNDATLNITALTHQYEELQARWSEQQELNSKLNEKLQQMEAELMGVCDEKEHLQEQLNTTRTEHTNQVAEWEDQIDQREKELNELKDRYDDLLSQFPGIDIEAERREYKLMAERLEQKDDIIVDLEQKILTLSKEIHRSTEVMNRISEEKARASQEKRQESHCCQEYRMQLEKANERCREMQEILADVEDDNRMKSKQAVEAIEALRRYENGEEGLASALKKVHRLQEKVNSRDKQIRQLISEINLANEIAIENGVLRKRLGIEDDEVVATSSILAKQKKIAKVNERLALKLRASEEMRLQLKLEKNDLKRQLAALAQNLKRQTNNSDVPDPDTGKTLPQSPGKGSVANVDDLVASIDDVQTIKFCEKCMKQYNVYDSMKHCKACIFRHSFSYCDKCVGQLQMNFDEDRPKGTSRSAETDANHHRIRELEQQYITVIEENENLREGMHEILEKLREYDAMSDRLTIDRDTLEKLLAVLSVRPMSVGWHSGMRLPNDLLAAARERELLLKERLAIVVDADANGRISKSIQSTESVNDSGNVCNEDDNSESIERLEPEQIDFSEQVLLKAVEIDRLMEKNEQLRVENERLLTAQDELQVTQKLYTEMLHITNASENEKDRLLVQTVDRLRDIESGVCTLQRKVDFLKAENDNLHNSLRQIKSEHLNLLHELRLQLATRSSELKQPEAIDGAKGGSFDSLDSDQIEKLESELMRMKSEATNIYNIFLKNIREVDKDHLLEVDYSKLNQLSIVDNSLAVEFVTKDEYKRMKDRLDGLERELQRELVKSGHLEELLKVSNEQIRSQQSLISKYSEEEVSLRHLVVDLQSASNEKYLLARANKELELVREQEENLKLENSKMKLTLLQKLEELDNLKLRHDQQRQEFSAEQRDNKLKIRFLKKSLQLLTIGHHSYLPTSAIPEFVKMYAKALELRESLTEEQRKYQHQMRDEEYERIFAKLKENLEGNHIQDKINLIKYESQSEYLTRQLILCQEQVDQLQRENKQLKMKEIDYTRHWDTLELLFGEEAQRSRQDRDKYFDKAVQVTVETSSKCINTIPIIEDTLGEGPRRCSSGDTISDFDGRSEHSQTGAHVNEQIAVTVHTVAQRSLESQLKQAMMLASTRSALLLEAESRLSECQGRIKLLEKSLEEKESLLKEQAQSPSVAKHDRIEDSILSTTIGSLQNLLLEKDTTLSRYQELLKSERSEHSQVYDENMAQIRNLKKTIDDLEQKLYEKQKECDNIATQLNDMNRLKALQESVPEKPRSVEDEAATGSSDAGAIVYTDKIIENIYEIDEKKEREIQDLNVQVKMLERNVQELENEQKRLQLQLREANAREKKSEKLLREKEMELVALNDRLTKETHDLREFTETIASAQEIEQLKEMLEEKDRHIQDLTETLSQFHEDQRSFMNDTSLHSAEQVSQLSADLNRSEASNRVLKTQIEALKRQIVSIQQREKQSRDLVKTLKNQLIKRPVIAMKADRMSTPREDQLARRVQQLETELLDTKDELRKQTAINENRRAKTAAELDLWNKQKRWQQMAERLKVQLKEQEVELEKLKVHFNTAKTTIARLERDRTRLNSAGTGSGAPASLLDNKYQPSGSPDQYCSTDSTESEDTSTITTQMFTQNSKEIIEALKSRIESQQRRIIAMELDRKGSNTVAHELEKMQEKLCNMEAQNVRLEAKTLQLQLDNDMLRQSDESERLKRQIKHLEEYVIALKEEIAKATAGCPESINFENLCVRCSRRSGTNDLAERNANLEQTVLTLKRMIEKLRAENKHLKEHRNRERAASAESFANPPNETIAKELYDRLKKEHEKLQQNLTEALNKVSVQQVEIELLSSVTCTRCKVSAGATGSGGPNRADPTTGADEELRDKLEKKSQLLEKAKILLQRAAAKERYLKEQIDLLRRKCSDLQNVPVIDEISE